MDPYGEYKYILFKVIGFFGILSGTQIFDKNYKPNIVTLITSPIGISYPLLYLWTMIKFRGDLAVLAIAYMGIGTQVNIAKWKKKTHTFWKYSQKTFYSYVVSR